MLLDIRADHLNTVLDILKKHVPEREVWAFGSRAKWLAKEYSDLDLCIIGDTPVSFRVLGLMEEAFDDSDLPYKVDLVDWATTSESFRKIIERDKVVVQRSSGCILATRFKYFDTTIGDQLTLQRGFDITKAKQKPGTVPVVSSGGISSFHNEAMVNGPGVVIGRKGSLGTVFYIEEDYWPHDTSLWVKDFKGNHPRFVYYFFLNIANDLKRMDVGAANPALNRNHVHPLSAKWPELQAQEYIVTILSGLDDKIALNRRINQTLEAIAQALFKSWFVDFDPVRAKIAALQEGRDPLRAAMSVISGKSEAELEALPPAQLEQLAATAALFPEEMEECELGEIPKGWSPAALSTICDLNASNWSTKNLPISVNYVDLANTKNGEIIEAQTLTGVDIPSRARRILAIGDTIVGTVRPGNRSFALVGEEGLTGSTGFAVLHPVKVFLREYIYLAATNDENIERLAHLADGGAYPAVRSEIVVSNLVPLPDENLLCEFHRATSHMFDQVMANRRANRTLIELRDTLLPKLLSGELPVASISPEPTEPTP